MGSLWRGAVRVRAGISRLRCASVEMTRVGGQESQRLSSRPQTRRRRVLVRSGLGGQVGFHDSLLQSVGVVVDVAEQIVAEQDAPTPRASNFKGLGAH